MSEGKKVPVVRRATLRMGRKGAAQRNRSGKKKNHEPEENVGWQLQAAFRTDLGGKTREKEWKCGVKSKTHPGVLGNEKGENSEKVGLL